jgi:hypothetical protein
MVADLDASIPRWAAALGYAFSPVAHYRTDRWRDAHDPEPHTHDGRISMSREGAPYIELMEGTGDGSHALSHGEGIHHFGFAGIADLEPWRQHQSEIGVGWDGQLGEALDAELWFTEAAALDGVRFEYIGGTTPPPLFDDHGAPLPMPSHGNLLWPENAAPAGTSPLPHAVEVVVDDLDSAAARWSAASCWRFLPAPSPADDPRSRLRSIGRPACVDLIGPSTRGPRRSGADRLVFLDVADIDDRITAIEATGIGTFVRHDDRGRVVVHTDPDHLNGVGLALISPGVSSADA